jgi:hypothetical protein
VQSTPVFPRESLFIRAKCPMLLVGVTDTRKPTGTVAKL